MIVLGILLLVVGYTVMAVVVVDVLDATDHSNSLENLDKMILGAAWPVVVVCLPALLVHRLLKWVPIHYQGVLRRKRLEAEAAASSDPDL